MFGDLTSEEMNEIEARVQREIAEQEAKIEPIPCSDCKREGRAGVMMTYRGIVYHQVTALGTEYDENYPGGIRTFDEQVNAPYATWRCEHGHEYTDGY